MTAHDSLDTDRTELIAELCPRFPAVPSASVVACVLDAYEAVDYVQVAVDAREGLVARLARAHLEELAGFYPATDQP